MDGSNQQPWPGVYIRPGDETNWLAARTTCTGATGAPGTLIKTGQSRSLAKDVTCIPQLRRTARMCRCPASWANSQKPRNIAVHATKARRLLFSTDVGSHQAIIRARVDGNERMELEGGVTVLTLDQQLYHAYQSYRHQWEEQKNLCFHAYPAGEQHYCLGGICVLLLDDKTGLQRITVNGERRSVELQRLSHFTDIWVVWTPDAVTQYSRRLLVPQASDANGR
ncbi:uncharacterized protein LOC6588375 [Drosophila persimilis]|uniref:uncharacterized protein LOC6588375 n=1 Tax=Drosophila persimilis TaxID=7234 RepID=UPI000F089290|nr:uncharacterized protein LOC6588375 [Drosophila persimilis]